MTQQRTASAGFSPNPGRPAGRDAYSILTADFGNVNTRLLLIEQVEGVYTVVAQAAEPTTAGFPAGDIGLGLLRGLRRLGAQTGRRLAENDGRVIVPEREDGAGVDRFVATASIGRPLRTVLIGLDRDISIASGLRAASGTYVRIVDTLMLGDARSNEDQLNAIVLARPDLIFFVGGLDDGAERALAELAQAVAFAVELTPGASRPIVLFAGNRMFAPTVENLLAPLTTVLVADNVRPALAVERLAAARVQLARAYDAQATRRGSGFERVGAMTAGAGDEAGRGIGPNASSYDTIARYLGAVERGRSGALIADIGSSTSTLAASVGGVTATAIRTDIGIGHSAASVLEAVGFDAVRAWLPFEADDELIEAYALNKTARPHIIPPDLRALYLEHALWRAALIALLAAARPLWTPNRAPDSTTAPMPPLARIIGAGAALCNTGRPGLSAMLLLDALQPVGVTRLQADESALIPALGALAADHPEAVVQLLDGQALQTLCTAVSLSGGPRPGRAAARVVVVRAGGERERYSVPGGVLWRLSLPLGVRATVTITAARGLHIDGRRHVRVEVEGGTAGFLLDTRGRPLVLGRTAAARAEQIPAWIAQATDDPVRAVPPDWLEPRPARQRPIAPVPLADDAAAAPGQPKRGRFGRRKEEAPPPADEDVFDPLASLNAPTAPAEDTASADAVRARLRGGTGRLTTRRKRDKTESADDSLFY